MPPRVMAKMMTHGTQHATASGSASRYYTMGGTRGGGGPRRGGKLLTKRRTTTTKYALTPSMIANDDERLPRTDRNTGHTELSFAL